MKPEEQRIAIAKACGWQFIPEYYHGEDQPPESTTVTPDGRHLCGYYPDYLNDLNAMHGAVETLRGKTGPEWFDFQRLLMIGCGSWMNCIQASAAVRAEAFLKTLSLWKNDN